MKYPTGQSITYTASAKTDGYVSGDHTYLWQFDDSTSAATASTSKAWSTGGIHRATVTATNTTTSGTASAFKDVEVGSITSWVGSGLTANRAWATVIWCDTYWMMASGTGQFSYIATSPDGITWTEVGSIDHGAGKNPTKVVLAYMGGTAVLAVSNNVLKIYYSSDAGVTWAASNAGARDWRAITAGNGKFAAASRDGKLAYSTDGITWVETTSPSASPWAAMTYANGLFVVVSEPATLATQIAKSSDAITWTNSTSPANESWSTITGGNGIFIAANTTSGTSGTFMRSTDGTTWASVNSPVTMQVSAVEYGNGLFVAIQTLVGTNGSVYSSDGLTWTPINQPLSGSWTDVAYGTGRFVSSNLNPGAINQTAMYLDW